MTTEIEWRRQWRPDLRSCPWQPIEIDGDKYLIKTRFTQDSYEILVTDLTNFWFEELADKSLKKRVQKLNPSVEASVTRILDQIRNCLECPEKGTTLSIGFKEEGDENKMILKLNSQLAGMPFVWHFIGKSAEQEKASQHLIVPLMAMVGELMRRQKELIKVLETKDREIEDYKSQGIKTSRKHLETTAFVETAFENKMLMAKGFDEQVQNLGSTAFEEPGQDLYRQIMTKHAWLHRSPIKDNEDNDIIDDGSLEQGRKPSTDPSWGTSRLPPSLAGSKSLSPDKSPKKSPAKSPHSSASNTPDASPVKDSELLRRQALERRLEQEDLKKQEKSKKKKKIAF